MKAKKLFPYPVLYSEPVKGNYTKFKVNFELNPDNLSPNELIKNNILCFPNIKLECTASNIKKLIKEDKAKALLLVTAPGCIYRKVFELNLGTTCVNLGKELSNGVEFQVFIVVNGNGVKLESPFFDFPYEGRSFVLNHADIIGISDKQTIYLNWNWNDQKDGLFKFRKNDNLEPGIFSVDTERNHIFISTDGKTYDKLKTYVRYNTFQSFIQSVLLLPAVTELIANVQKEIACDNITFEECMNTSEYLWFQTLVNNPNSSYKLFGEENLQDSPFIIAQKLFSEPITKSFVELERKG